MAFLSVPRNLTMAQKEALSKEWHDLWQGTKCPEVKLVVLPYQATLQIGTVPAQLGQHGVRAEMESSLPPLPYYDHS